MRKLFITLFIVLMISMFFCFFTACGDSSKQKTYTISFDSDGGDNVPTEIIKEGECAYPPIYPAKEGKMFDYWQLDGEKYDFSVPVVKNITLKAIWSEISYVTINYNTNTANKINPQKILKGRYAKAPYDPARQGFSFEYWEYNNDEFDFNTKLFNDVTLTALWSPISTKVVEYNDRLYSLNDVTYEKEFYDFSVFNIVMNEESNVDYNDILRIAEDDDSKFYFTKAGSYTFSYNNEVIAKYDVAEYEISKFDFSRSYELKYSKYSVGETGNIKTGDMFKWNSSLYQPHQEIEGNAIKSLINYMEIEKYDSIKVSVYGLLYDNGITVNGRYIYKDKWGETLISLDNIKQNEKLDIWSQSQKLTEMYFYFEFVRLQPEERFALCFSTVVPTYKECEVAELKQDMFYVRCTSYQPYATLSNDGIKILKEMANGKDVVRIHYYQTYREKQENKNVVFYINDNSPKYTQHSEKWQHIDIDLSSLENFKLWYCNDGVCDFWYYFEFINYTFEDYVANETTYFKTRCTNSIDTKTVGEVTERMIIAKLSQTDYDRNTNTPHMTLSVNGMNILKKHMEDNGYTQMTVNYSASGFGSNFDKYLFCRNYNGSAYQDTWKNSVNVNNSWKSTTYTLENWDTVAFGGFHIESGNYMTELSGFTVYYYFTFE